jgi:hypothetical protein
MISVLILTKYEQQDLPGCFGIGGLVHAGTQLAEKRSLQKISSVRGSRKARRCTAEPLVRTAWVYVFL